MQPHNSEKEKIALRTIGETIKELREMGNLSLNIFSFENDLQKSLVSRVENGKNEIKIMSLWKIAEGLNIKLSKLIEIVEQKLGSEYRISD